MRLIAISGWLVSLILFVGTLDYREALRQEQMKKEFQPKPVTEEIYELSLCPPSWRAKIIQRIDKRNSEGEIIKKRYQRACI